MPYIRLEYLGKRESGHRPVRSVEGKLKGLIVVFEGNPLVLDISSSSRSDIPDSLWKADNKHVEKVHITLTNTELDAYKHDHRQARLRKSTQLPIPEFKFKAKKNDNPPLLRIHWSLD